MRIFNMAQILVKHGKSNNAAQMLASCFGDNYMYCGWGNRRLGLHASPLANPKRATNRMHELGESV